MAERDEDVHVRCVQDGPMLEVLKEASGRAIELPRRKDWHPDRERLAAPLTASGPLRESRQRSLTAATILAVLAFVAAGCQDDESEPAELPAPVAKTRSGILDAAESRDYARLRPLIDLDVFLSDYGFGSTQPDPVERWRKREPKPLETISVLLRMPYSVRETNEGTLYQWPRFGPDSTAEDMSDSERTLLRTIMTEAQIRDLIRPEYGYTAPRLGILASGTWWFFILERGP